MVYDLDTDPYIDSATGAMRNRLGITDTDLLMQAEELAASFAAAEILESLQPQRWDAGLLRHLHHELFSQLYTWAGQYRTVEISKGSSRFAMAQYIPVQVDTVLASLEQERQDWQPGDPAVLDRLAHYYSELNAVHPLPRRQWSHHSAATDFVIQPLRLVAGLGGCQC